MLSRETNWDKTFIQIAELYAAHSSCAKYHVGAILVKEGRVISSGYNGTVSGQPHCIDKFKNINFKVDTAASEDHHKWSEVNEIHAEANCIAYAAKNEIIGDSCTMYCTLAPCIACSRLIAATGIKKVVYKTEYNRSHDGIDFLRRVGVEVTQFSSAMSNN